MSGYGGWMRRWGDAEYARLVGDLREMAGWELTSVDMMDRMGFPVDVIQLFLNY